MKSNEHFEFKDDTSDILHNKNCHLYLSYIVGQCTAVELMYFDSLKALPAPYSSNVKYGDLYTQFMHELRENTDNISDELIIAVYENDAKVLEQTHRAIKSKPRVQDQKSELHKEHAITSAFKGNQPGPENATNPSKTGSASDRLFTILKLKDYQLQYKTGLPQQRNYQHNQDEKGRKEIRLSTQAQYISREASVDPLFERYLVAKKNQNPANTNYVYFNCLRYNLTNNPLNFERNFESVLSHELHGLEKKHSNIAVISLPSDDGIMSKKNVLKTRENIPYDVALLDLKANIDNQKDFHISETVKTKLTTLDGKFYDTKVAELLELSFEKLGKKGKPISEADKQAVYFHFLKFELPKYILGTLNASAFNFTCKDGIDRGGIASLYFNLMKFAEQKTHTDDEVKQLKDDFERGMHAAPTMVKGRGMNDNIKILWNVINHNAALKKISWMPKWLKDNEPKQSRWEKMKSAWNDLSTAKKILSVVGVCLLVAAAMTGWGLIAGGLTWAAAGSVFAGIGASAGGSTAAGVAMTVGAAALAASAVGYKISEPQALPDVIKKADNILTQEKRDLHGKSSTALVDDKHHLAIPIDVLSHPIADTDDATLDVSRKSSESENSSRKSSVSTTPTSVNGEPSVSRSVDVVDSDKDKAKEEGDSPRNSIS